MATNQTIDGELRALLERIMHGCMFTLSRQQHEELRALLDADSLGETLDDESLVELAAMEAAQQQGEPVAWTYCPECGCEEIHHQEGRHKQCAECYQEWFSDIDYTDVVRSHLKSWKTEQPAPVAEPFAWHTEDYLTDKSATTYDAATAQRWIAKGWPVTPLYIRKPAPVAVVMPERKHVPDFTHHPLLNKECIGWNACIGEWERLNGGKP